MSNSYCYASGRKTAALQAAATRKTALTVVDGHRVKRSQEPRGTDSISASRALRGFTIPSSFSLDNWMSSKTKMATHCCPNNTGSWKSSIVLLIFTAQSANLRYQRSFLGHLGLAFGQNIFGIIESEDYWHHNYSFQKVEFWLIFRELIPVFSPNSIKSDNIYLGTVTEFLKGLSITSWTVLQVALASNEEVMQTILKLMIMPRENISIHELIRCSESHLRLLLLIVLKTHLACASHAGN